MKCISNKDYIDCHFDVIIKYIKSSQSPKIDQISELTSHILISDIKNACELTQVKDYGIETVLYLGMHNKNAQTLKSYAKRKINHIYINVELDNILPYLEITYNTIHKNVIDEKKILVHCDTGLSISVAILLYYFMRRYYIINYKSSKEKTKDLIDYRITYLIKIIQFIKEIRPCINPQPIYIHQLLITENILKKYFDNILSIDIKKNKCIKSSNKITDSESESNSELDMDDYFAPGTDIIVSQVKYDKLEDLLDIKNNVD